MSNSLLMCVRITNVSLKLSLPVINFYPVSRSRFARHRCARMPVSSICLYTSICTYVEYKCCIGTYFVGR